MRVSREAINEAFDNLRDPEDESVNIGFYRSEDRYVVVFNGEKIKSEMLVTPNDYQSVGEFMRYLSWKIGLDDLTRETSEVYFRPYTSESDRNSQPLSEIDLENLAILSGFNEIRVAMGAMKE